MILHNDSSKLGPWLTLLTLAWAPDDVQAQGGPSDPWLRPYLEFSAENITLASGGLNRGSDLAGLLDFGIDVDLGRAAGLDGWQLKVSGFGIVDNRDNGTNRYGNFHTVSNITARGTVRLFRAELVKSFGDGNLILKVGQLALDDDFMGSDGAATFINASFGPLPVVSGNIGAPIFPVAALGIFAEAALSNSTHFRVGVFDGYAGAEEENTSGLEFTLDSDEGATILVESATELSLLGRPSSLTVGGQISTGVFPDWQSGSTQLGNWSLHLVMDQALSGTRGNPGLASFIRFGVAPQSDRNVVTRHIDAGLTHPGFGKSHTVGLGFVHSWFSNEFATAEKDAGNTVRKGESAIELAYQAQLGNYLMVQPDLQYVIGPLEQSAHDAMVVGLRMVVSF